MYVDVLKVQLAASEVDIFYQMINQLLTRSSIMKKEKIHYIYRPWVNTDALLCTYHDVFEYEKKKILNAD